MKERKKAKIINQYTPDQGNNMKYWQNTKIHIQANQEVSHFQAGAHEAAMNRQESMTSTMHK